MRKTGDLRALDQIERLFGRVAFTIPRVDCGPGPLFALEAAAIKKFGEQMEAISSAMKDDDVTHEEAKQCLKEVDDTMKALARIKAYLEQC
jgi:hypothetical protein